MSEEEYGHLLDRLLKYVKVVPQEHLEGKMEEAWRLIGRKDAKDVVFLAAALSIENAVVWSNDADFKVQKAVRTLKTKEMAALLFSGY